MIRLFLVTIDVPDGATIADARDYIEEAVKVTIGGKDVEDPMWNLDRTSVKVRRVQDGDVLR